MPIATYELELDMSSSRLWDAMENFAVVLPKACPEIYASIEDVEGPDGVIRYSKFGNVVANPSDRDMKEKVIVMDQASMTMGFEQLEGPHLSSIFTKWVTFFKITPFGDNKSKVVATFDYEGGTAEAVSCCQQGFEASFKGLALYLATGEPTAEQIPKETDGRVKERCCSS